MGAGAELNSRLVTCQTGPGDRTLALHRRGRDPVTPRMLRGAGDTAKRRSPLRPTGLPRSPFHRYRYWDKGCGHWTGTCHQGMSRECSEEGQEGQPQPCGVDSGCTAHTQTTDTHTRTVVLKLQNHYGSLQYLQ